MDSKGYVADRDCDRAEQDRRERLDVYARKQLLPYFRHEKLEYRELAQEQLCNLYILRLEGA